MPPRQPPFTSEQVAIARKIHRQKGTLVDAMREMGVTNLGREAARKRLIDVGIRFYDMPSTHLGTSKALDLNVPFKR